MTPSRLKGSGDVKYHKGFSADLRTPNGNVHTVLAFNPSHLEVVNPVVEGSVRARQERRGDVRAERVLPLLVHGDAAFAGQGVVMETLQLSQARGFFTGGTVHVIINNQVGFTTSEPSDARSTIYCSDVAKMLEVPIFHVNADDPEAVVFVTRLALKYRMRFRKDVVIDLVCYRRHGHNEADEPAATQPTMYRIIRQHPDRAAAVRRPADRAPACSPRPRREAMFEQYRNGLDEGRPQARASLGMIGNKYTVDWSAYSQVDFTERVLTGVELPRLRALGERITEPAGGLHAAAARGAGHRQPPQDARRGSCRLTGAAPRPSPTPPWWRTGSVCASPARTAAAGPSSIATRCCTTRTPMRPTSRCSTSPSPSRTCR